MAISNNEIKRIKSLSMKKYRDQLGLFTVEGEKIVNEALSSSFEVEGIYRRDEIGEEAMKKISQQNSPSPVLAVVKKPADLEIADPAALETALGIKAACPNGQGLYLALDSMRDPGNLGTVLRIADWFGIEAIFASPDTVDVFNSKTVQATMGAVFRVRFHYCDLSRLCGIVRKAGGNIYGTFLNGENMYGKNLSCGEASPSLIVIGNESEGISEAIGSLVTDRLYIPPYPMDETGSESLNAAVATAITVAEFRRQGLQR